MSLSRLVGAAALAAALLGPSAAQAQFFSGGSSAVMIDPATNQPLVSTARTDGGPRARVSAIPREVVSAPGRYGAGTVVVNTQERRLYLINADGTAIRYGIGVGRDGFQWGGTKTVTRKAEWPDWRPPAQMLRRRPDLPRFMVGGPQNPLGARALYLGSSLFRIHGSNEPHTIGTAVSSGCFRMTNDDVTHLYERVRVGTRVVVLR